MRDIKKVFGGTYSNAYDELYHDKNYTKECDFLEDIFKRYHNKVKNILDLGCGTGRHDRILNKRGYDVTGVDRSKQMLNIAAGIAEKEGLGIKLINGDITKVCIRKRFNAVISMFAVVGYQITNEALLATFATARKHLKSGGMFVFDCWNGAAVLADMPKKKRKLIHIGKGERIIRLTDPKMDIMKNTVHINFKLQRLKGNRIISSIRENHCMRFYFPLEIGYFLKKAGFREVHCLPFLKLNKTLSIKDWNMNIIALV